MYYKRDFEELKIRQNICTQKQKATCFSVQNKFNKYI